MPQQEVAFPSSGTNVRAKRQVPASVSGLPEKRHIFQAERVYGQLNAAPRNSKQCDSGHRP